jgi:aldehyde dehydrogenase (NAD+)
VLVKSEFKDAFIQACIKAIEESFGEDAQKSADYPRIINRKRFEALTELLKDGDIIYGGKTDLSDLYISPTLITGIDIDHRIMQEEIFGPILPILSYDSRDEILKIVRENRYPLACYYFGKDKDMEKFILNRIEFGGGCINMTLMHFGNPDLPVGGLQTSGSGHYHGWHSFECFSNAKTIVKAGTWVDPWIKYPPFNSFKKGVLKKLLG